MSQPYIIHDKYTLMAHADNYRARSVYKLEELDKKFRLFRPGMRVLDLAAAPGSWLQYTSKKIQPNGHALGLDLQEIEPVAPNVTTIVCDITDKVALQNALKSLDWQNVDLILSDIAPATTGIHNIDHARSLDLNRAIVDISKNILKPGSKLVLKVFDGNEFQKFISELKKQFKRVEVTKSQASRQRSREVYVVCY
jgi:23S rRNA (uridine2552-2'-O)-methyltransferase